MIFLTEIQLKHQILKYGSLYENPHVFLAIYIFFNGVKSA